MIKFHYKYSKTGPYYRPLIPITLRHNKAECRYIALIDSGADFNIFHSELANVIGIDLSKLNKITFSGINKGTTGIGYQAVISLGIEEKIFDTPVIFSNEISPNGYGILGQSGFFHLCQVKFNYKDKDIILKFQE